MNFDTRKRVSGSFPQAEELRWMKLDQEHSYDESRSLYDLGQMRFSPWPPFPQKV